jgi:acyl transferase domain-containing protein
MAFGKDIDPQVGAATQFQPGVRPEGAGKPKGSKHINTWVQEILNDPTFEAWIYDAKEGVKKHEGIPLPAIIKAQVIKAMAGDTKAYDALIKSGWATKQELDLTSDGQPLQAAADPTIAAGFAEYLKGQTKNKS